MKNNKKKHRTIVMLAVLACLLLMLTACGGKSLTGQWYMVSDEPSAAEYENMEFTSDGKVICEGVEGTYDDSGEAIACDIYGAKFTCTWDNVDGHDVLFSDWNNSYYAKSVDEAKEVRDALNEGADAETSE